MWQMIVEVRQKNKLPAVVLPLQQNNGIDSSRVFA